jgi:hypothetical protein
MVLFFPTATSLSLRYKSLELELNQLNVYTSYYMRPVFALYQNVPEIYDNHGSFLSHQFSSVSLGLTWREKLDQK